MITRSKDVASQTWLGQHSARKRKRKARNHSRQSPYIPYVRVSYCTSTFTAKFMHVRCVYHNHVNTRTPNIQYSIVVFYTMKNPHLLLLHVISTSRTRQKTSCFTHHVMCLRTDVSKLIRRHNVEQQCSANSTRKLNRNGPQDVSQVLESGNHP